MKELIVCIFYFFTLSSCNDRVEDDALYLDNALKDTLIEKYDTIKIVNEAPFGIEDDSFQYSLDTGLIIKNTGVSNEVAFWEEDGVLKIPASVNGTEMFFIFDTGATDILISTKQANILYSLGKLSESDIIGNRKYMDASGKIFQGTLVKLKEVVVGNITLTDVDAAVVNNSKAPLLFGQSALKKFFKVTIDYNRKVVVFE